MTALAWLTVPPISQAAAGHAGPIPPPLETATLLQAPNVCNEKVVELAPTEYIRDPVLWALLTMLPPFPEEIQLDAPTRRPDEPDTAGLPQQTGPTLEQAIEEALRLARESLDTAPADEG
jgi:hypothetical protein